jgi:hypothetical protein
MHFCDFTIVELVGADYTVRCRCKRCGRIRDFLPGSLIRSGVSPQRRLADLKWRCAHCSATAGFRISIFEERFRGDKSRFEEHVIFEP